MLAMSPPHLELAPDGERVPHHAPLLLPVHGHDLPQVVQEPHQLEPLLVRVVLPYPLGGLERVHGVGQVHVGVALVHEGVEHLQGLHRAAPEMVEAQPLAVLHGGGKMKLWLETLVLQGYKSKHNITCLVFLHVGFFFSQYFALLGNITRTFLTFSLTNSTVWFLCISLYVFLEGEQLKINTITSQIKKTVQLT